MPRSQPPMLRRRLLAVALALPLLVVAPPAVAQAPACPELTEAQERYDNGRFEDVITLATQCLERDGVAEAERQRAYRLIGLSYIGQDLRDSAREAVRQLITLVPNFEPDPVNDPPQFIQMIDEVKAAEAERLAEEARRAAAEEPTETETEGPTEAELEAEAQRLAEESRRAEERREEARRSEDGGGGIGKWLLIGGVVVGGGVLAAVLLGGGGDGGGGGGGGGIPTPPLPPTGQ